jgi:hypothetical protein
MADFIGFVTCEFKVPKGMKLGDKNGPFKDYAAFEAEIKKRFVADGEVLFHFRRNPEIEPSEFFSFHGYDHPDVKYFEDGVPEDYDMTEEDPNSGFLPLMQCIAEHLRPGITFVIYYNGYEKLRPPLCGMSWYIHNDCINEVDICDERGMKTICRRVNEKWELIGRDGADIRPELQEDLAWFERNRQKLHELYADKWLAIKRKKILAVCDTFSEAYAAGLDKSKSQEIAVVQAVLQDPILNHRVTR